MLTDKEIKDEVTTTRVLFEHESPMNLNPMGRAIGHTAMGYCRNGCRQQDATGWGNTMQHCRPRLRAGAADYMCVGLPAC